MNPRFENILGNDFVSFREKAETRIGSERLQRYGELEPLLELAEYRLESATDNCEQGLVRLFDFDALYGKKRITKAAMTAAAPALWVLARIKYAFRPKAAPRPVFSNTFIRNQRYGRVQEQVEKDCGCTRLMTFLDTIRIDEPGPGAMIRETLRLDAGRVKPIWLPGSCVAGRKLQKTLEEYYRRIHRMTYGVEKDFSEEIPDELLDRLRDAYLQRALWLRKHLRGKNMALYLTVNQYQLRDLLVIRACRELGIRTVQQEHHAMEFIQYQFDPDRPMHRFSLAGSYGFWSFSERRFHEKIFLYDNPIYPLAELEFLVTGDTEITYEQALGYLEQYPTERKLTFVTPGVDLDTFRTQEEFETYSRWRWKVFEGLREFSGKQGIRVCVRYRPGKEQVFREKEIPVLTEWGFEISRSVPENLMEDLCSSMAVMSSATSALATARLLGKPIYRVEDWEVTWIHVDDSVHEVALKDLPDLTLSPLVSGSIGPENFFDIKRLL